MLPEKSAGTIRRLQYCFGPCLGLVRTDKAEARQCFRTNTNYARATYLPSCIFAGVYIHFWLPRDVYQVTVVIMTIVYTVVDDFVHMFTQICRQISSSFADVDFLLLVTKGIVTVAMDLQKQISRKSLGIIKQ